MFTFSVFRFNFIDKQFTFKNYSVELEMIVVDWFYWAENFAVCAFEFFFSLVDILYTPQLIYWIVSSGHEQRQPS